MTKKIIIGDPGWGQEKKQYKQRKPGCWGEDPNDVLNYPPKGEEWAAGMDFTLYNAKKQQMRLGTQLKYNEPYYSQGTPAGYFNQTAQARQFERNERIKEQTLAKLQELGLDLYGLKLLVNEKAAGVYMSR